MFSAVVQGVNSSVSGYTLPVSSGANKVKCFTPGPGTIGKLVKK